LQQIKNKINYVSEFLFRKLNVNVSKLTKNAWFLLRHKKARSCGIYHYFQYAVFFLGKQVSEQKVKKEFRMTYENHGHAKSDAIGINPT